MQIRTRSSIGADGYVTTPDGRPPLVRDPQFVPGPLVLEEARALPEGAVEIVYACTEPG